MMTKIDTAMVLAAGLGTRMRPAAGERPKPLVPLARKPLIDHVLDRLANAGVARAVVNVHHMADQIEQHLAKRQRPAIVISDERTRLLETGGGVKKALPLLPDDGFIVHNSDAVWQEGEVSNLARLMEAWDAARMDCLLLLVLGSAAIGYNGRGDFSLEADGRIRRRRADEVVPFVYTGVQILHPRAFAATPDGPFSNNLVWNQAMLTGRAFGVRMDGLWMHVGKPEELAAAEQAMARPGPLLDRTARCSS
jgi:N-acetyl-alpha-D-muramate 1-phosphate uridylyltransferase